MTNKERLRHPCPTCYAKAGDPCKFPTGRHTDRPHKTRGPGQHEKHIQEGIDRRTARARAAYGPLFQELADAEVVPPTVAEVKLANRFAEARAAERSNVFDHAMNGLEWVRLHHIRRTLATLIGEFWAEALWEYATRVYRGNESYIDGFLANCLTTTVVRRIRYELRFDPARIHKAGDTAPDGHKYLCDFDGRYLHDTLVWPPLVLANLPVLTRAEWDTLFPRVERERGPGRDPEHDDGGLFDRVVVGLAAA